MSFTLSANDPFTGNNFHSSDFIIGKKCAYKRKSVLPDLLGFEIPDWYYHLKIQRL
jgi:hypothetical protein